MSKSQKLGAREAALMILNQVEQDKAYSNLQLNKVLKNNEISGQEAALVTELVYGTIQHKNTLDYFIQKRVKQPLRKLQLWVLNLLRISFYQMHYLDRIPDHAVVNEAVSIAKKMGHRGISGMVNGVLRSTIREADTFTFTDFSSDVERIAITMSHPTWLVQRWIEQYGMVKTEKICDSNNQSPSVSIRVNTLKHTRDAYVHQLQEQNLSAFSSPLSPQGIVLSNAGNMTHSIGYEQGDYSIQDESSMLVAEIVDPKPGMKVLDACAAPGGKTTHLAEKMQDEGEIWANDIHEHKIKLIDQQVNRLQLKCIHTQVGDALELVNVFPKKSFDRILLDAPCSGFGVIRRKPDIKWAKSEEDIKEIAKLQRKLIESLSTLLKDDGYFIYSTCTIEKSENEEIIKYFLAEHSDFTLDTSSPWLSQGKIQIFPQDYHSDGFFIARLRKK